MIYEIIVNEEIKYEKREKQISSKHHKQIENNEKKLKINDSMDDSMDDSLNDSTDDSINDSMDNSKHDSVDRMLICLFENLKEFNLLLSHDCTYPFNSFILPTELKKYIYERYCFIPNTVNFLKKLEVV